MYSPLEQFRINPYIRIYNKYIDISISNITIYIIISTIFIIIILKNIYNNKLNKLSRINTTWDRIREIFYMLQKLYIQHLVGVGGKKTIPYIPYITSILIFILMNNIMGLIPYSVCTTAQIALTLTLSLIIVIGITLIGIYKYKYKFIYLFIPSGVPIYILFIIILIEIISYLSRIISLSVRLSANMLSGHSILHIISSSGIFLSKSSFYYLLILPFFFILALYILEFGVSIIQAYVFSILTLTYIKDVLYIKH